MDAIALLGRVLMSAIFIMSGLDKAQHASRTIAYFAGQHLPVPQAAFAISVLVELGGGLAILIGLKTRIVGLIMALFCIATALIAHTNFAVQEQMINFMKNVCMAGGFLQLVAWGAGRYSVDRR